MDEQTLLEWINCQHGTSFQLAGKLAGGRQDGGHQLIDAGSGARSVADFIRAGQQIVDDLAE